MERLFPICLASYKFPFRILACQVSANNSIRGLANINSHTNSLAHIQSFIPLERGEFNWSALLACWVAENTCEDCLHRRSLLLCCDSNSGINGGGIINSSSSNTSFPCCCCCYMVVARFIAARLRQSVAPSCSQAFERLTIVIPANIAVLTSEQLRPIDSV